MIRPILLLAALTLSACGILEPEIHSDCAGKCDSERWVDFRKASETTVPVGEINFSHLKEDAVFEEMAEDEKASVDEIDVERDGEGNVLEAVKRIKGKVTSRSHVWIMPSYPGMTIDIAIRTSGFLRPQVQISAPANEAGMWHSELNVATFNSIHGRSEEQWRTDEKKGLELESADNYFGEHALRIGPLDETDLPLDKGMTYEIEIKCTAHCDIIVPKNRTRYPFYFAHGFSASADSWKPLFNDVINPTDPGWRLWAHFQSVPGYKKLYFRSDQLRAHITHFLDTLYRLNVELPDGDEYWRINLVAHSMGGLDSRTLIGDERFNEKCGDKTCTGRNGKEKTFCCSANPDDPDSPAVSCCAPGPNPDEPLMWRDVVASITTLSTPHRGSEFADWGLCLIYDDCDEQQEKRRKALGNKLKALPVVIELAEDGDWIVEHWTNLMGWVEEETFHALRWIVLNAAQLKYSDEGNAQKENLTTLKNLSTAESLNLAKLREPDHERYYAWVCAVAPDRSPACGDGPLRADFEQFASGTREGEPRVTGDDLPGERDDCQSDGPTHCRTLPPPLDGEPTIFSWAAEACVDGKFHLQCPATREVAPVSSALFVPHLLMDAGRTDDDEIDVPDDGVVSILSARWGIFMGTLPGDHFRWGNPDNAGFFLGDGDQLGWFERLREAGY